jgi:adenylosuccinate synthase
MIRVVVGAQFGSEGKGMITGHLAKMHPDSLGVRVGGPNAGHCVIGRDGVKYALRQLPVGAVVNDAPIAIAPGSEIDLAVMAKELEQTQHFNTLERLVVSPEATIIQDSHKRAEARIGTGTTGKGIGAARCARLMRNAYRFGDAASLFRVITGDVGAMCDSYEDVLIEGTQGYGLGSHAGYYPFCTSGDCRVQDFLAQSGVSFYRYSEVIPYVVARLHPIRIAGNSGPLPNETTWEQLGIEPEYTTVTHKERRVGHWDPQLVFEALEANGGPKAILAVTFLDYEFPPVAEQRNITDPDALERIAHIEAQLDHPVHLVGTGPDTVAWMPPKRGA